jgi:prevent-host-death family protein
METTLTVTEAARNFADVVNRAYYRREATTLLKNGKPVARVVPAAAAVKTGKEIAARMAGKRPRLTPKEAEAFDADLREARAGMPKPVSLWD